MTPAEYRDWNMGLARYWQARPEHPHAKERIAIRVRAARRGNHELLRNRGLKTSDGLHTLCRTPGCRSLIHDPDWAPHVFR